MSRAGRERKVELLLAEDSRRCIFPTMVAGHIHDAIDQVKRLQEAILSKRLFKGYSGKARIVSGVLALAGAAVLASGRIPEEPMIHLAGWGVVLALSLVINYGALGWWYLTHEEVRANPMMLKPALDAVPALIGGAILTVALVAAKHYDLLFGAWMLMYGLAQTSYRKALPGGVYLTGLAYMACGAVLLLWPISFLQPWPMGTMFLLGEWAGGICLMQNKEELV